MFSSLTVKYFQTLGSTWYNYQFLLILSPLLYFLHNLNVYFLYLNLHTINSFFSFFWMHVNPSTICQKVVCFTDHRGLHLTGTWIKRVIISWSCCHRCRINTKLRSSNQLNCVQQKFNKQLLSVKEVEVFQNTCSVGFFFRLLLLLIAVSNWRSVCLVAHLLIQGLSFKLSCFKQTLGSNSFQRISVTNGWKPFWLHVP